jgi:heme/copper-type cytochrome/quinol oxidase subunit 2
MKKITYAFLALALPLSVSAQGAGDRNTIDGIVQWLIIFINDTLVYLVFALAFVLLLFGILKYFFSLGSNADEKRQEGKKFIAWGIIALVIMITVWGIVNVLVGTVPALKNPKRPCLPTFNGECAEGPARSSGPSFTPAAGSN